MIVTGCLLWASALLLEGVWARVLYEARGPFNVDSPIYWAVGRGILNGLLPYTDLFETKPPGIFLLSSLSIWFGGNMQLGALAQAAVFLHIPLLVVGGALRIRHIAHRGLLLTVVLSAIVFGSLLSLYSAERSGEFQVESFGALFVLAYAAVITKPAIKKKKTQTIICALLLYCAIGLKEPFIMTALACSLLLARRPSDIVRTFMIPVCVTAVAGFVTLLLTGYLDGYLHVYLPEMLGKHIEQNYSPLWQRGFFLERTYTDIAVYVPALAWMVAGMCAAALLQLRLRHSLRHSAFTLACVLSALYLMILAIGVGGSYWNHHFTFAIPGYAALFFVFIRETAMHWHRLLPRLAVTAFGIISCFAAVQIPDHQYGAYILGIEDEEKRMINSAAYIDAVLDACSIDRYLFLGPNGNHPYGFTKHSPIGPLFIQYNEWLQSNRPEFRKDMLEATENAFFVVKDNLSMDWLNVPINRHLEQYFTTEPWPCAAHIPSNQRYEYLFRLAEPNIPLTSFTDELTTP